MDNEVEQERIANALSGENVRRYLDGEIFGDPLEGTLARRVHDVIECVREGGIS